MSYKIHGIVRDKLIEIHALLELHSTIVVRKEDKEKVKSFFDEIPKIIRCLE